MSAGSVAVPNIIPLKISQGAKKNTIDADTPIEIHSETPNARIYFTLDGSKPLTNGRTPSSRSTVLYVEPFRPPTQTLNDEKLVIKALAVSSDGLRQSHVVTKAYNVLPSAWPLQRAINDASPMSAGGVGVPAMAATMPVNFARQHRNPSATAASQRAQPSVLKDQPWSAGVASGRSSSLAAAALICPSCCAPRLANAKFCNQCGTLYPLSKAGATTAKRSNTVNRKADSEKNSNQLNMGMCVACRCYIPLDRPTCVVCEADLKPQLPTYHGEANVVCPTCRTPNEGQHGACIVCGANLDGAKRVEIKPQLKAMAPADDTGKNATKVRCTGCKSANSSSAKFCNTCGKQLISQTSQLTCPRCHAPIATNAHFCKLCGAFVRQAGEETKHQMQLAQQADHKFSRANAAAAIGRLNDVASDARISQPAISMAVAERSPFSRADIQSQALTPKVEPRFYDLSATSPGRGYWRQQLTHIEAHLRDFTKKDKTFQSAVGEYPLGKIISASGERAEDDVFSLVVDFELRLTDDGRSRPSSSARPRYMDAVEDSSRRAEDARRNRQRRASDSARTPKSSRPTTPSSSRSLSTSSTTATASKRKTVKTIQTEETVDLLRQLDSEALELDEVQRLLNEGADPNAKNGENVPALALAVKHLFSEAVKPLKEAGANIDLKFGPNGNTALHEAVLLGSAAKQMIQTLLSCGANAQQKNSRGQTAHDLAIKKQFADIADILAAHISHQIIAATSS